VLAGPNGSGKSTIKAELRPEWIGVFVNADDIERGLLEQGGLLHLPSLGLGHSAAKLLGRFQASIAQSAFAQAMGLTRQLQSMRAVGRHQLHVPGPHNSYLASVLADAIRRELLAARRTFTFETVMSSADKLDFMREARVAGYRVYLYFVATDDPAINLDRVRRRVAQGGHAVPEDKVKERYVRSIGWMTDACSIAHRAFVFDNSGSRHRLLVQVNLGDEMLLETARLPRWFTGTALWREFSSPAQTKAPTGRQPSA
jgi:predicted ABC-type ATPase